MGIRPAPESSSARRKNGQRNSRNGCRNCKIRRVKCDETRPACRKCSGFHVLCNYAFETLDLQPSYGEVTELRLLLPRACSANQTALSVMNRSFCSKYQGYELNSQDLEVLNRFQTRTIPTLGTARSVPVYQSETFRLACLHPVVMHAIMALVAKHDRVSSQTPYSPPTSVELHHEYSATALLNMKLSKPLLPEECDAVGAVGALLGAWTLASIEAPTPEEAWPLRDLSPDDLQWLKLSDGKTELLKLANFSRPESCFRSFFDEYLKQSQATNHTIAAIAQLPGQFLALFDLGDHSNPSNNPYYRAVQNVALLQDVECDHENCLMFFSFTTDMQQEYQHLLRQKDPRALLLMAFWYAKVCRYQWWIARRAMIECKAICIYLDKYHATEAIIQDFLAYPKARCGLWDCNMFALS